MHWEIIMQKRAIILSAIAASTLSLGAVTAPAFAQTPEANAEMTTEVVYAGEWTKKSFKSAGGWAIVNQGGKTYVELDAEFKTRRAPDLKIFLSPLDAGETNGKNATNGSVLIAPLTSNKGAQRYELPEGVDLAAYKSILIHCEAYSKLWSAADLA